MMADIFARPLADEFGRRSRTVAVCKSSKRHAMHLYVGANWPDRLQTKIEAEGASAKPAVAALLVLRRCGSTNRWRTSRSRAWS